MPSLPYKFLLVSAVLLAVCVACGPQTGQQASGDAPSSRLEEEHQLFRAGYADSVNAGLIPDTAFKGSARREETGSIGEVAVKINYGSPGKRGRILWNGLVAYDQIWVSGSHWATAVSFSKPVRIAGTEVPAGMYGFFSIPGPQTWTLILNREYDMHLAEGYKAENDVVRIQATPISLAEEVQRLTYRVRETEPGKGFLSLEWDQLQLNLPMEAGL